MNIYIVLDDDDSIFAVYDEKKFREIYLRFANYNFRYWDRAFCVIRTTINSEGDRQSITLKEYEKSINENK